MIVLATIPVGLTGIALEHTFRTIFAKPAAAAVFLLVNGLILLAGERLRRTRPEDRTPRRSRPPRPPRPPPGRPGRALTPGRQAAGSSPRSAPPPPPTPASPGCHTA